MDIIVPKEIQSHQAVSTLMEELRKLNNIRKGPYAGIDSPTLRRQIGEVEEALELLIAYYDR